MQPYLRYPLLRLSFIGAFVSLAVGLQLPRAQLSVGLTPSSQAAPHADSGTVRLWISALKNDHPVQDLKKDELKLWIRKEEQNISSLYFQPPVPLVLGLVIDVSGSERPGWPGPELKLAPSFFQRVIRPGDQVFLADFNDKGRLDAGPTGDLNQISQGLEKLRGLRPYGGTALYDTIEASCNLLKSHEGSRHLLVVVSDGEDNASRHTRDQAVRAARLGGTTVCFIARSSKPLEPSPIFNAPVARHGARAMVDIVRATGGELFSASSKETEMMQILDSLAEFVRGQYALDFEAGSTISEGDKIKIKCLRRHVTIVAPESY